MATIVNNSNAAAQTGMHKYWAYNGFDCCVTREVFDVLNPRLGANTHRTYKFQLACQAPAMAMMFRGVLVDETRRQRELVRLKEEFEAEAAALQPMIASDWTERELVTGTCPQAPKSGGRHRWPKGEPDETRCCSLCGQPRMVGKALNPLSDDQVSKLFYRDLGLQEMTNKKGAVSVDEEALGRLERKYPKHSDIVRAILRCRGLWKSVSVLNSAVSPDGRMRSTFVVGGPETGRWASTSNPYNDGTNLQNIAEKLRGIFIADPGHTMFYADLEQAESCTVAYLAQDENYINAHKSGDVHTYVSRLVWPDLPWNGDLKKDKELAETLHPDWDPEHSYRLNCKRVQHGSNYLLTPPGMARIAHIPIKAAREAQDRYFDQFPGIRQWHKDTYGRIKETGTLVSPVGRQRQFFGRIWDGHTVKQGVAFSPQSTVADILNTALWRVWAQCDPELIWLLAQVHDAILGSHITGEDHALETVLELMKVPVLIHGREMVIPVDVKCGKNWAKYHPEDNPDGMR